MQQASGQARGLGNEIKGVGTVAAGIIKAQVFTRLASSAKTAFTSTVAAASNLKESINATNVTFGTAADDVLAIGENASQSMGLSQRAFNAAAVQFSAFAKTIAGEGGDVAGVVQDITGRAADFASVMNLDVEEALRLFQSGLAGETEPLRKYGIDVSAASVQTFAYANGIAEAGQELTEQEKVLARYGAIMEQTANTAGDFANTSEDFANSQRTTSAELENFQAQIGEDLLPLLEKGSNLLGDMLVGMQNWNDATADWNTTGAEFFDALGRDIEQIGDWIGLTDDSKDATDEAAEAQQTSADTLDQWARIAENAGVEAQDFAGATAEMEEQASGLTDELKSQQDELDGLMDSMFEASGGALDLTEREIDYRDRLAQTKEAIEDNGKSLDLKTEKGRANQQALIDLARDGRDLIQTMIEEGESAKTAGSRMEDLRDDFIRNARQAGLTAGAARRLADDYGLIPSKVRTTATLRDQTARKIANLQARLAAITRQIDIRAHVSLTGNVSGVERLAALGTRFMATGGIVGAGSHAQEGGPRGRNVLINEARPEVVSLPDGSRVIPSLDQAFDRNQMGGGGGTVTLVLESGGSRLDDLLVEVLRNSIRVKGGDVQRVLGGN